MLNKKQFKEDDDHSNPVSSIQDTKKTLCMHIRKCMSSLGFNIHDSEIFTYGSVFFNADIADESDLDLVLVVCYDALIEFNSLYANKGPEDLRKCFFFTELLGALQC
jgi:hypothetical protein